MGFQPINDENHIRLTVSTRAHAVITGDMEEFGAESLPAFLNRVVMNFAEDSDVSIVRHVREYRSMMRSTLDAARLSKEKLNKVLDLLTDQEKKRVEEKTETLYKQKTVQKTGSWRMRKELMNYLTGNSCEENEESGPYGENGLSKYVRCILEDYGTRPFIEREKIYQKETYQIVENAVRDGLQLTYTSDGTRYDYWPFKIVPDATHTQSYLVGLARVSTKGESKKMAYPLSMARLKDGSLKPTRLKESLNSEEKRQLDEKIAKLGPANINGKEVEIHVRLTKKGLKLYNDIMVSRPVRDEKKSTASEYVFHDTDSHILNYFIRFGEDAEIVSPVSLRQKMIDKYQRALQNYQKNIAYRTDKE